MVQVEGWSQRVIAIAVIALASCGQASRDSQAEPPQEPTLPVAEPCTFSRQQISDGEQRVAGVAVGLAWNGNGYGVVWQTDASVGRFALLDADGQRLTPENREVSGQTTGFSLAFTGDGYGLSWGTGSSVEVALLDTTGALIDSPQSLIRNTRTPLTAIAFGGDGFGVGWDRGFFAKVDLSGHASETSLGEQYPSDPPRAVFTGEGYAIAWPDEEPEPSGKLTSAIYFSSFRADGTPLVVRARVSPSYDSQRVSHPELLWTGDSFALGWNEAVYGSNSLRFRSHFMRFDRVGQALTSERSWPGRIVGMASTADESAILYFNGEGTPSQLFLARLDSAGARRVQDPLVAELDPFQPMLSPIVMSDGAYTFAWVGGSEGSNLQTLYFGRAVCP